MLFARLEQSLRGHKVFILPLSSFIALLAKYRLSAKDNGIHDLSSHHEASIVGCSMAGS